MRSDTLEVLRTFALLAAIAFAVGFLCRLGVVPSQASAQDAPSAQSVSGPASDDWNLPKRI